MFRKRIYMDHAATTPLDKRVEKEMFECSRIFANPSSLYKEGVEAKKKLDEFRKQIGQYLHARKEEIVFTSGGTESNNLAILGVFDRLEKEGKKLSELHAVTTAIEHSSVLECFRALQKRGLNVSFVAPQKKGIVHPTELQKHFTDRTVLVSVMYANNEIGTVQPVSDIARSIRHFNKKQGTSMLFHTDASQAPLYLDINTEKLGVDLMTLDAHKIYGPKGMGLLYIKNTVEIEPIMYGGGQERGLRSTTENLSGIAGFAKALEIAVSEREKESERLNVLRDRMIMRITEEIPEAVLNGDPLERLPNNINIAIPNLDSEFAVIRLDEKGVACSTKSSCLKGEESSYVIDALDSFSGAGKSSLRFTLGRKTSKRDIDRVVEILREIINT